MQRLFLNPTNKNTNGMSSSLTHISMQGLLDKLMFLSMAINELPIDSTKLSPWFQPPNNNDYYHWFSKELGQYLNNDSLINYIQNDGQSQFKSMIDLFSENIISKLNNKILAENKNSKISEQHIMTAIRTALFQLRYQLNLSSAVTKYLEQTSQEIDKNLKLNQKDKTQDVKKSKSLSILEFSTSDITESMLSAIELENPIDAHDIAMSQQNKLQDSQPKSSADFRKFVLTKSISSKNSSAQILSKNETYFESFISLVNEIHKTGVKQGCPEEDILNEINEIMFTELDTFILKQVITNLFKSKQNEPEFPGIERLANFTDFRKKWDFSSTTSFLKLFYPEDFVQFDTYKKLFDDMTKIMNDTNIGRAKDRYRQLLKIFENDISFREQLNNYFKKLNERLAKINYATETQHNKVQPINKHQAYKENYFKSFMQFVNNSHQHYCIENQYPENAVMQVINNQLLRDLDCFIQKEIVGKRFITQSTGAHEFPGVEKLNSFTEFRNKWLTAWTRNVLAAQYPADFKVFDIYNQLFEEISTIINNPQISRGKDKYRKIVAVCQQFLDQTVDDTRGKLLEFFKVLNVSLNSLVFTSEITKVDGLGRQSRSDIKLSSPTLMNQSETISQTISLVNSNHMMWTSDKKSSVNIAQPMHSICRKVY